MYRAIINRALGCESKKTNQTAQLALAFSDQAGPYEVASCMGSGAQWPGAQILAALLTLLAHGYTAVDLRKFACHPEACW